MTRAAGLLLEATERDAGDGENRLTEILAAVLQSAPSFASAFMAEVGLPTGAAYEVNTQVHVEGRFIDMEVLALDAGGAVVSRLWAEHKVYAEFGPRQMETYLELLSRRASPSRALVAIVRDDARRDADVLHEPQLRPDVRAQASAPPGSSWRTWQEVAVLVANVGRRLGGRDWRNDAEDETSSAGLLLLHELVSALERRELAFMDAIDTIDVTVIAAAEEAREKIQALFARVLQHLQQTPFTPTTGKGMQGRSTRSLASMWQHLNAPSCWATERYEGWAELQLRDDDTWKPDAIAMGVPCLAAGFTFETRHEETLVHSDLLVEWRDHLRSVGIAIAEDGGWLRCVATLYLTEVVTSGLTLDDQAAHVARWAERTLTEIVAAPPPASI